MKERDWPEEGELVVCTIDNVKDFVAFARLDEYENRAGMIPISEVATGWVKYIRDYVREGQKAVCKVLNVDPGRGHIDLSLKDVNEHQRREKIREWKNEQKAHKWIGFVATATAADPRAIEEAIYREYGLLFSVFEDVAVNGEAAVAKLPLEKNVAETLHRIALENVKIPNVSITGYLDLTSNKPDGINIIRRALRSALPKIPDVEIELTYVGAPTYRIKVTAPNYKKAEKSIEKAAAAAIRVIEKTGGSGKFNRKQKSG
ncbi:MAG: translation initiation factor IF-2 subunit alpha [Methanomicrobiales archaeon]|nr:translation initiation factor IF-2 subunit alpha [Methanomicrobiales archaeon]